MALVVATIFHAVLVAYCLHKERTGLVICYVIGVMLGMYTIVLELFTWCSDPGVIT